MNMSTTHECSPHFLALPSIYNPPTLKFDFDVFAFRVFTAPEKHEWHGAAIFGARAAKSVLPPPHWFLLPPQAAWSGDLGLPQQPIEQFAGAVRWRHISYFDQI